MEVAGVLSSDFEHARIDLYATADQIFFTEITHYSSSSFEKFNSYEVISLGVRND
jgi:hypothetical protein